MMALQWCDPPERVNAVFKREVIAELRANPGQWALIRIYNTKNTWAVKNVKRPTDIEIQARHIGGRIELYARAKP